MSYVVFTLLDTSNETTSVTVNLPDLAVDGTNYPAITALIAEAQARIEAITGGVVKERAFIGYRTRLTNAIPSDESARESKWIIRYQDDVTLKVHWLEVGCADRSLLEMNAASDFVNTASIASSNTDLVAWVNGSLVSPAGNDCTLLTMEHTGWRG